MFEAMTSPPGLEDEAALPEQPVLPLGVLRLLITPIPFLLPQALGAHCAWQGCAGQARLPASALWVPPGEPPELQLAAAVK